MEPPRIQVASSVLANLAYTALVLGVLLQLYPPWRRQLHYLLAAHAYYWRLGRPLQDFKTRPGWEREALEARGKRPGDAQEPLD